MRKLSAIVLRPKPLSAIECFNLDIKGCAIGTYPLVSNNVFQIQIPHDLNQKLERERTDDIIVHHDTLESNLRQNSQRLTQRNDLISLLAKVLIDPASAV